MKKLSLVFAMVLMSVSFLLAQRTITGKITDADTGEGLISASVLVEGTARGTVTDAVGNYSIDMPQGTTVLVFSYTGYNTQKVTVGAENVINIVLTEGIDVSQVVVTALGVKREKKSLGFAQQSVKGEQLTQTKEVDVNNAIAGKVAGVQLLGAVNNNIIGTNANGDSDALERNIMSGNSGGFRTSSSSSGTGNKIQGNYIGTDVTGNVALQNNTHGLLFSGNVSNTLVGTNGDGVNDNIEGNVISGHYGKLAKDFFLSRSGSMILIYYFNPNNNDRNLEFDLKKNLFKWGRREWERAVQHP